VRAYALNAASRQLLESLRAWPAAQHATPVQAMQVHGDNGGEVASRPPNRAWKRWPGSWMCPPLEASLAEAVRYQPLIELLDARGQPPSRWCAKAAPARRAEFGVHFDVTPYGQHGIAARLRL
jgi:hypothetical protein